MELQLYEVDTDYTAFLHGIDDHVRLEHIGAKQRKFVGVVMEISGIKYYQNRRKTPSFSYGECQAPMCHGICSADAEICPYWGVSRVLCKFF